MNIFHVSRFTFLLSAVVLSSFYSSAQVPFTTQPEKAETRKGNKEFNKGNYADAEADYKKALDKKNNMPEATFNLGDAVYQQKRYEEAVKQFQLSAQNNPDPKVKAKAYHNLGNTHLEQEKWQEAVKAYKSALKINPNDADTKYNLAYANEKLREQQQGGGGQNNKKDQQKDKQDQKQNEQKEDNKDQEQDKQQAKDQEQKQQQGQQSKLSKEEAEQMLQALQNEEQKTNQKVQQKQMKVVPVKILKDW